MRKRVDSPQSGYLALLQGYDLVVRSNNGTGLS